MNTQTYLYSGIRIIILAVPLIQLVVFGAELSFTTEPNLVLIICFLGFFCDFVLDITKI